MANDERTPILFVLSGLERGGTELKVLALARRLPSSLSVRVCSTSSTVPLREAFEQAGATVRVVPVGRPWLAWHRVLRIGLDARRDGVRVVNTFDLKGLMIALVVRRATGGRVRLVHHLVNLQSRLSRAQRAVLWSLIQYTDAVVCDARSIAEQLIGARRMRPEVLVIPNGVDAAAFAPDRRRRAAAREALDVRDRELVLGCIANFRPEKNHRLLVDAFAILRAQRPSLRLVCVGSGPLLGDIRARVSELGLDAAVSFTGSVEDVRPHLVAMDVFVLPSSRDAFSNAVLQAMASGVPCVCSRTGDHPYLLAQIGGPTFDPSSVADCVASLGLVLDHPRVRARLARDGRALVEQCYSSDVMVRRYADFFRRIASATRATRPRDVGAIPPAWPWSTPAPAGSSDAREADD